MSALTPAGSTAAWRRTRQQYADQLAQYGSRPCWRAAHNVAISQGADGDFVDEAPDCTGVVTPFQPWVLGHKTDRALGGTDTDLGYECVPCSNYTGGKLSQRLRRLARRPMMRRAW